jgi:hypothetical protein
MLSLLFQLIFGASVTGLASGTRRHQLLLYAMQNPLNHSRYRCENGPVSPAGSIKVRGCITVLGVEPPALVRASIVLNGMLLPEKRLVWTREMEPVAELPKS